jgi:hypothetical protein
MNRGVALRLVALACFASMLLAGSASAQDMPKRKSGLWELKMSAAHGMVVSHCVDQARDDALRQQVGRDLDAARCTRTNFQRSAAGLSFDSACEFNNSKMKSHTTITGDFNSAYKMEMRTTYDPPLMGKSEGGMTIDAKWVGACKPGQRPGDMVMPGGMTMNVYDMLESKKK